MAGNSNSGRRSPRLLIIQRTIELESCKIIRDKLKDPNLDEATRLKLALPFALQSNSARHAKDIVELRNAKELPHAKRTHPGKIAIDLTREIEAESGQKLLSERIRKHA